MKRYLPAARKQLQYTGLGSFKLIFGGPFSDLTSQVILAMLYQYWKERVLNITPRPGLKNLDEFGRLLWPIFLSDIAIHIGAVPSDHFFLKKGLEAFSSRGI